MIVSAVNQKLKFVVQGINQYVDTWVKGFCYAFFIYQVAFPLQLSSVFVLLLLLLSWLLWE